jgi:hypothetical protein
VLSSRQFPAIPTSLPVRAADFAAAHPGSSNSWASASTWNDYRTFTNAITSESRSTGAASERRSQRPDTPTSAGDSAIVAAGRSWTVSSARRYGFA